MKTLNEIKHSLSRIKDVLKKKYKVKEIGVFGSYVRNESKRNSDIDILVEVGAIDLFDFIDLRDYLSGLLEAKVDLVSKNALKPRIGKHILNEVVYI